VLILRRMKKSLKYPGLNPNQLTTIYTQEVQPSFGRGGRCVYMKCAIAMGEVCRDEERVACVFTKSLQTLKERSKGRTSCVDLATGGIFYI
jgi:hypothetical protein